MSSDIWTNLASGLIGSVIGGVISLGTSLWSLHAQNKCRQKLDRINVKHSLSAIRSELFTVYKRYSQQMGHLLEHNSADQCPFVVFPIQEEYFPIYKNNTSVIGRIQSDKVREQVITAYILAVAMIDSVRMNNSLVEKIDNSTTQDEKQKFINDAQEYWTQLRIEHCNLKEAANLAYQGLEQEIASK